MNIPRPFPIVPVSDRSTVIWLDGPFNAYIIWMFTSYLCFYNNVKTKQSVRNIVALKFVFSQKQKRQFSSRCVCIYLCNSGNIR